MADQIQFRRDTAANWTSNNPTLAQGEVGLESDTNAYKVGDGSTAWNSLTYNQLSPEITTLTLDGQSSDPSTPASGDLVVYAKPLAGRMMLKQQGPSGLTTPVQPFLARNKIGYWASPGNAATLPGVFGYTSPTVIGSATTRSVVTTSMFTRARRLGYTSATSTNAYAAQYVNVYQVTVGDGSGNGGFYKICRFGISDALVVTGASMFCGLEDNSNIPANGTAIDPTTLTNAIGMGHGTSDTTMHIYYGGSAAQTPIDLGSNFPANTHSTDLYDLALYAPPNSNNTVYYEVTRLNTGDVATGTLTGTAGTVLPSSTTLLSYQRIWRCNGTSGKAVAYDVLSDYIETDN
ncbi:hypothetical protein HJC99_01260 [Candidatus Saccharibacteria bacterium]|nr:hypothetical protein [Candidatus Saccharibacteria bacterium]